MRFNFIRTFTAIALVIEAGASAQDLHFATGIKIGEVTATEAIIWTRLTRAPERVGFDAPMPKVVYLDEATGEWTPREGRQDRVPKVIYPEGYGVETIQGAAPGAEGEVRVRYRRKGESEWRETDWRAVDPERDFTRQFRLDGLDPETRYELIVESRTRSESPGASITGEFRTAPAPQTASGVLFTVGTCQAYDDLDSREGYKIYSTMRKLDPDFFVMVGDIVYYDQLAKTLPLARWHWARTYSLPYLADFHRSVASYFIKDDHDTWMNDCWPGQQTRFMGEFTLEQGLEVFREQVPMGERTYRTVRWGRDLQLWMVEGRDYRSPNTMPDGPEKTIWGGEQKAWFKRTVNESDATFRILISPTPVVGPDRENKRDNHSNRVFQHEGDELRAFIAGQKNMFVVCGDRHWQYVSVDAKTGVKEFSCGPASDEHAGGWEPGDTRPEHQYLNVTGGFLAISVEPRPGAKPVLTARHHAVDGRVLNEERIEAE